MDSVMSGQGIKSGMGNVRVFRPDQQHGHKAGQ